LNGNYDNYELLFGFSIINPEGKHYRLKVENEGEAIVKVCNSLLKTCPATLSSYGKAYASPFKKKY
jgi:hypothetical protein